jgi:hypothetical protein
MALGSRTSLCDAPRDFSFLPDDCDLSARALPVAPLLVLPILLDVPLTAVAVVDAAVVAVAAALVVALVDDAVVVLGAVVAAVDDVDAVVPSRTTDPYRSSSSM